MVSWQNMIRDPKNNFERKLMEIVMSPGGSDHLAMIYCGRDTCGFDRTKICAAGHTNFKDGSPFCDNSHPVSAFELAHILGLLGND